MVRAAASVQSSGVLSACLTSHARPGPPTCGQEAKERLEPRGALAIAIVLASAGCAKRPQEAAALELSLGDGFSCEDDLDSEPSERPLSPSELVLASSPCDLLRRGALLDLPLPS